MTPVLRALVPVVVCFALGCGAAAESRREKRSAPTAVWPDGHRAAVSLTYDDGLDTQLALAAPVLDAFGLKATFFLASMAGVDHDWALPNLNDALTARQLAWQALARNGHELASHTVHHPCPLELHSGQAPGYRLTDYDAPRISAELDDSVRRLTRLSARPPVSFAYPCESDRFGIGPAHTDYAPLVRERFPFVRGSRSGMADPASVHVQDVPLIDTQGKSGEELRALVDVALQRGVWLVLLFHGVGEPTGCPDLEYHPDTCMLNYLPTSDDAHRMLVAYLAAQRGKVWTAPFGEVASHLKTVRAR
jgi:peptidoglycan/xylan/chitin deacetylase (PgdA/CDA1 family)